MDHTYLSRRGFLGQASCAGLGYLSLASTLSSLKALNAAAMSNSDVIDGDEYKAIVVLFKYGGNDSFNTLIPYDQSRYDEYYTARGNVGLLRDTLNPVTLAASDPDGKEFALHPSLNQLAGLFNSQKAAFVANVGTLSQKTTKAEYENEIGLPVGLYSHNDQQEMWQTSITDQRTAIGWGGRIADLINDMNVAENVSMLISLGGSNVFQSGNSYSAYNISDTGSVGFNDYGANQFKDISTARTRAMKSFMEDQYDDIFKRTYAQLMRRSRDADADFTSAIDNAQDFTGFSPSGFGKELKMIARTISAKDELNFKRQIFFIGVGGWDHHKDLLTGHEALLSYIDSDLKAFQDAMETANMDDCVLLLELSEFGRTISSNDTGTDHAWGGHVYAMGGTNLINGGLVHGEYPSLDLTSNNPLNAEVRGRMIPQISTDEYFGEIARWFGVAASDLNYVFPNIGTFYDYINEKHPVGILKPY